MAYTPRFGNPTSDDNTGRVLTNTYKEVAYAATIAIVPNASNAIVNVGQLTGALTMNATVSNCKVGDRLTLIFAADGTGRTVTLGTGLKGSAATIVVTASKKATYSAIFDGVEFVETGRAITA